MRASVLVEVESTALFEAENVNWRYCVEHATFTHKDACEFILHIYARDEEEHHLDKIQKMVEFGCTAPFVAAYVEARKLGAERVLFYA